MEGGGRPALEREGLHGSPCAHVRRPLSAHEFSTNRRQLTRSDLAIGYVLGVAGVGAAAGPSRRKRPFIVSYGASAVPVHSVTGVFHVRRARHRAAGWGNFGPVRAVSVRSVVVAAAAACRRTLLASRGTARAVSVTTAPQTRNAAR